MFKARLTISLVCIGLLTVFMYYLVGEKHQPIEARYLPYNHFDLLDIENLIKSNEKVLTDIKPGLEKTIVWAGTPATRTEYAIVYVHGFSASLEELRPVPDLVAKNINANLFFTRLTGHARTSEAMIEGSVQAWLEDLIEAFKIGTIIGEKIIFITCSTGGTLAANGILKKLILDQLSGIVFISPNFGVQEKTADLLTWPLAEYWAPIIAGKLQINDPRNEIHAQYWTTTYPTVSLIPMMKLVEETINLDKSHSYIPALFYFSPDDKVVDPKKTEVFIHNWKGPKQIIRVLGSDNEDNFNHLITGKAVSPSQVERTVNEITRWHQNIKN